VAWRAALQIAVVLTASFHCGAQPTSERPGEAAEKALLARLLNSPSSADLARGAYLAANYEQKEFVPSIIPLLGFSDRRVQLVAIDALIRLRAEVPDGALEAFLADNWADPAMVLLAQDSKRNADYLVSLSERLTNLDWEAANAILVTAPPEGYAARLFRDLTIHIELKVWDRGIGYADGLCGWIPPVKPMESSVGFPPIYQYSLRNGVEAAGWTSIGSGPFPVSYIRQDRQPKAARASIRTSTGSLI